jgi:hypothetical protein
MCWCAPTSFNMLFSISAETMELVCWWCTCSKFLLTLVSVTFFSFYQHCHLPLYFLHYHYMRALHVIIFQGLIFFYSWWKKWWKIDWDILYLFLSSFAQSYNFSIFGLSIYKYRDRKVLGLIWLLLAFYSSYLQKQHLTDFFLESTLKKKILEETPSFQNPPLTT